MHVMLYGEAAERNGQNNVKLPQTFEGTRVYHRRHHHQSTFVGRPLL